MALVSLQEAARILGVSHQTIRRRLRDGTLQGHKVREFGGEAWRVEVPEAPSEAPPPADLPSSPTPGEVERLSALVTTLEGELDSRRQEAQQLHQEVQQLHVLLRQALDLLRSPRRDAMPHEAEMSGRSARRREPPVHRLAQDEERPIPPLQKADDGCPRWWALGVQPGPSENAQPRETEKRPLLQRRWWRKSDEGG